MNILTSLFKLYTIFDQDQFIQHFLCELFYKEFKEEHFSAQYIVLNSAI